MNIVSIKARALSGLSVLALACVAGAPAWAQGLDPFAAPPQSPGPERALPTRDSENFEPFGARVGSFKLFPKAELWGVYNSNIYATQANEIDDWIAVINPGLALESDFSLHYLSLSAVGAAGRYADNSAEDFADYGANATGRLDLPSLGKSNLFGRASYAHLHEDRGSPNAANGAEPTEYSLVGGQAGFIYKPNRLSAALIANLSSYDYDDVATSTGVAINNDDRDRDEFSQILRVGYEFLPGYEGFVRGTLKQVNYDQTRDDGGLARSNDGYEAVGGVKIDFGRITDVEVFAGYISTEYDDARLPTIDGPTFGGAVNWNPIRPLRLRGYAQRSIEETTQVSFAGYTATTVGLSANYEMFPRLQLNALATYSNNEYERNSTFVGTERQEDVIDVTLGAKYFFSRNYYVNPSYRFTTRDTNVANSDYDRNLVFVKLGVQY